MIIIYVFVERRVYYYYFMLCVPIRYYAVTGLRYISAESYGRFIPNYTYVMCSVHNMPTMSFEKISYGNNNISSDFRHKLKRISVVLYTREYNIIIIIM